MKQLYNIVRRTAPKPLRDKVYSGVANMLKHLGFIPSQNAGPVDFQHLDMSPEEAIRRSAGLPSLFSIRPEHLRNVGPVTGAAYFPCSKDAGNPFVETILQYLENPELDYAESALKLYHDGFQPATIAEALGVEDDGNLHFLLHRPPILTFSPWARPPIDDWKHHLRRRQYNIDIENRSCGHNLSHEAGHYGFGPVGEAKGKLEIDRLAAIVSSITKNGYQLQRGSEAVQVIVLRAGEEYRFICSNGHHRMAALAALGYETLPVSLVPKVIDRSDMATWPGVRKSVFTPEQALHVFDMFFHGHPPEPALRWWRG